MIDVPNSWPVLRVDSRYYAGHLNKRWCSYLLAAEPDRQVVFRAKGSPLWSGKGHYWDPPGPALEIYPRDEWFNIVYSFDALGAFEFYYVNIALPPVRQEDRLTYIDLDLDLLIYPDLSHEVLDEDEFLAHCDLWRYPPDLCTRARATLDALLARLARHDPLFGAWEPYWAHVPAAFVHSRSAGIIPPSGDDPAP